MYGNPNIKPLDITFDWLFDRISQEDVYIRYFGFCNLTSKFCNPLRNDKDPQCSFFWLGGILYFNDFAQNKKYTCVSVVMQIENLKYYQALEHIYSIFNNNQSIGNIVKITRPKVEKEYKDIQCKIQPFTNIDIVYLKQYGITSKLCKKFKVYSIKHYWINGEIKYSYNEHNPCIGYFFKGKWKLYFYKSKDYRFLTNVPHTELQGYDQLEWVGDLCIITKSMKDVICWNIFNIQAVAPHSEGLGDWKDKIPTLQKRFKNVLLNFDNDVAGLKAIKEVQKEFNLESIIFEEKDLSDTIKLKGLELTTELINKKLCQKK